MTDPLPFKITGVNHIGLAPKDPAASRDFFSILGLDHLGDEVVKEQSTETQMYSSGRPDLSRLEILIPHGADGGPIRQFLDKRGGGVHHVALTVDSVTKAIAHLLKSGVRMIDESPRSGAHDTKIAFVHPKSTGGLLIELVEESR